MPRIDECRKKRDRAELAVKYAEPLARHGLTTAYAVAKQNLDHWNKRLANEHKTTTTRQC